MNSGNSPPHHPSSIKHKHPPLLSPLLLLFKSVGQSWEAYFCPVRRPKLLLESLNGLRGYENTQFNPIYHGREWTLADVDRVLTSGTSTVADLNSRGLNLPCLPGRNSAKCFSEPPLLVRAVIWKRDLGRFQMNKLILFKDYICTVLNLATHSTIKGWIFVSWDYLCCLTQTQPNKWLRMKAPVSAPLVLLVDSLPHF